MQNLVSMLGTERDKSYHNEHVLHILDRTQLDAAYRSDWVAKKIVNVPAKDATREGRNWQAETKQIELIEAEEKRVNFQGKLKSAIIKSRLYGGAALVMGFGDDASQPLNVERVQKGGLKYLHAMTCHDLQDGPLVEDVNDPDFGLPEYYVLNPLAGQNAETKIHRSRLARLVPEPYPDRNTVSINKSWGDSVLQAVNDAVMNVAVSSGAVAYLMQEMKLDVVKIPDFMKNMDDPTYKASIIERFALANQTKSLTSTLIMDREEEWDRVEATFAGLPDVMKLYLLIASGAADIPATRLLGQSAVGLNATGDGDLRNYYDHIAAEQATVLSPALATLDEVIIRSALGSRPSEIWYEWAPLWQMSDAEKADIAKKKADTTKVYVEAAVIDPGILEKVVFNQLVEDGYYPGIEQARKEWEEEGGGLNENDPEVRAQFAESRGQQPEDQNTPESRRAKLKVVGDIDRAVGDAAPRTLYVRRDLMNAAAVLAHFQDQLPRGTELQPASSLHVTIAYSKTPVDWAKQPSEWYSSTDEKGWLRVKPGGMRLMERLGADEPKAAVVMQFASSDLTIRWSDFKDVGGCSWDFEDYQPHVTIAWDKSQKIDVSSLKPWTGELVFGPEVWEEIDENWEKKAGVDK